MQLSNGKISSQPIRVLHVLSDEHRAYQLNNLCDYTDRKEIVFSFVTFAKRASFVTDLEARGVRVEALDAMDHSKYPYAIKEIWKMIEQERVDIVHTHLFEPTLIGLLLAKLRGRKMILTRHHSDAMYHIPSSIKRRICLGLEKSISTFSDHIIAPSQMVRDILVKKEGTRPDKVTLIPYPQTTERFEQITPEAIRKVKEELGMDGSHLVLVCNSRIYHRKGHIYLFRALAPLIKAGLQASLYLVGTGPDSYRLELEGITKELEIHQHVRFLGWRYDALAIMAAADIIVHPSFEDALSSALIESVMLSRPIIATDISGARDTLDNGRLGLLVPPADAEAFRMALEKMLSNLDEYRENVRRGRQHIINYMGAAKVARDYITCYQRVLRNA